MPEKSKAQKFTDINQVNPAHRHLSGRKLSLDQINQIDEDANNHPKGFATGYYEAKQKFMEKHEFKNGLWRAK